MLCYQFFRRSICPQAIFRRSLSTNVGKIIEIAGSAGNSALPVHMYGEGRSAVLLIQEWWGVNDQMSRFAQRFAETGLVSLIPDIYRGHVANDAAEAQHSMEGLNFPEAVEDIHASAHFLRDNMGVERVGVVGFCMGGALSIATAVLDTTDALDCAVAFYGVPPAALCDPATLSKPLQVHFGEEDPLEGFSDPATFRQLAATVAKSPAASAFEIYGYPGQGHAFMNTDKKLRQLAGVAQKYNEELVTTAWERVDSFFNKHLRK